MGSVSADESLPPESADLRIKNIWVGSAAILGAAATITAILVAAAIWIHVRFNIELASLDDLLKVVAWPSIALIMAFLVLYSPWAARISSVSFAGLQLQLRETALKVNAAEQQAKEAKDRVEEVLAMLARYSTSENIVKTLYALDVFNKEKRPLIYKTTSRYLSRELEYLIDHGFISIRVPYKDGSGRYHNVWVVGDGHELDDDLAGTDLAAATTVTDAGRQLLNLRLEGRNPFEGDAHWREDMCRIYLEG